MRISELAKSAQVNVQTLRFYERSGLLPAPARTRSGYRDYSSSDLERVKFIRSCQELGFTLKDVKEVLELHRVLASGERASNLKPKAQARLLLAADRRLSLIDEKLRILMQMKREMTILVETLSGRRPPLCPVSGVRWA